MICNIHRTGRFLAAVTLTLTLLVAPVAWALPGASPGVDGWLGQLWHALTAWIAPAESGASMDPHGLQAPAERGASIDPHGLQKPAEQNATPETWQPTPWDPATPDASGEEDDSGASIDPSG